MKLSFIVALLLLGFSAFAQEKTLPVDEAGIYTFLEVKELKLVSKETMAANVKRFFKENSKSLKLQKSEKDTVFSGKGKMIIQKAVVGIGHPSGDATYRISIALRNGKYRLILTDFMLTPYERDRYSNFVPGTVSTPLERSPDKLNRAEWDANMAAIMLGCRKVAGKLGAIIGSAVTEAKPEPKKTATVSTEKW